MGKIRKKKLTRFFIIASVCAGVIIAVLLAVISQTTKAFTRAATRDLCDTQLQRREWYLGLLLLVCPKIIGG